MPRPVQEDDAVLELFEAFAALFGVHNGARALFAKGEVCEGTFVPSPGAPHLSRAPHLRGGPYRAEVRVSNFSGVPSADDGDPWSSPRGLALRVHLTGGAFTDVLAHSYDGFPVRTPQEFALFLRTLAMSGIDVPEPKPLAIFLDAHPAARAFLNDRSGAPASFAHETFYGVHAFCFSAADGHERYARYRFEPLLRGARIPYAEARTRDAAFLFDELRERLEHGPVVWRLVAQLATEEDDVADASVRWPAERPVLELGTLAIDRRAAPGAGRDLAFDPQHLLDGIALTDDPLLRARSASYARSASLRDVTTP